MGKINTLMKNWWIKGLTYQVILIFIKKNVITLRYKWITEALTSVHLCVCHFHSYKDRAPDYWHRSQVWFLKDFRSYQLQLFFLKTMVFSPWFFPHSSIIFLSFSNCTRPKYCIFNELIHQFVFVWDTFFPKKYGRP